MSDLWRSLCLHETADCPLLQEMEKLQHKVAELEHQVICDPLTGLYNKRHFDHVLETEMERSRRNFAPTSLILADIDRFKNINDSFGHFVGDQVLVAAAQVIRNELRMIDIACRYGGEEFAIILPSTSLSTAVQVAERLRSAISAAVFTTEKGPYNISASFGVSCFEHHQQASSRQLLERADQKLYEAKRKGRNRVCAEQKESSAGINLQERAALVLAEESAHDF